MEWLRRWDDGWSKFGETKWKKKKRLSSQGVGSEA